LRGRITGLASDVNLAIEFQARVGPPTRWLTFGVALTGRGGRFTFRYRFTNTTGVQVYALRARLVRTPRRGRPTISKLIHVTVTGVG
jgi:hypothetical protein